MAEKKNKPQRTDKNGRPYPAQKSTKVPAKGKGKAKPAPVLPTGPDYPLDWLFLHRQPFTVRQLKVIFQTIPGLDIEIWPDLQIAEVTFPNKNYVDFEYTPTPPEEEPILALLDREQIQTVYYVSVEPRCSTEELAFLQKIATESGGLMVADNDDLSPLLHA